MTIPTTTATMRKYFVVYVEPLTGGHGACEIFRGGPITGMADVEAISAVIAERHGRTAREVLVTSFTRFEEES